MGTLANMSTLDGFRLLGWCVGLVGLGLVLLRLVGPRVPRVRLRRKTPRTPRCPKCSYDLSGQADAPSRTCPECGCDASGRRAYWRRLRTRWAMLGLVMLMVAPSVGRVPLMRDYRHFGQIRWERGWVALVPTSILLSSQMADANSLYEAMLLGDASNVWLGDLEHRCHWSNGEWTRWHSKLLALRLDGLERASRSSASSPGIVRFWRVDAITRDLPEFDPQYELESISPFSSPLDWPDEDAARAAETLDQLHWLLIGEYEPSSWVWTGGTAIHLTELRCGDWIAIEGPRTDLEHLDRILRSIETADSKPMLLPGATGRALITVRPTRGGQALSPSEMLEVHRRASRLIHEHADVVRVYELGSRLVVSCDTSDHDAVWSALQERLAESSVDATE